MTYLDQGFQPCATDRYRARFEAIRDQVAGARLDGIFFMAALAKERGATASGSVVAVAALAAFGAFIYRDWIADTGFTNRSYAYARQRLQHAVQGVVYPGRQRRASAPRHFWAYF
jgi:hypothetical protein